MLGYNLLGYSAIGQMDPLRAQILVPALTMQINTEVPVVTSGASVSPPPASLQFNLLLPRFSVNLDVPTVTVTFEPQAPGISISSNNFVPTKTLEFKPLAPPKVGGGTQIIIGEYVVSYDLGGIGDSLVGEYSIGEGRSLTKKVNRIPSLNMQPHLPLVQSGVQVKLPAAVLMQFEMQRAEIDSRSRKLRVLGIAS